MRMDLFRSCDTGWTQALAVIHRSHLAGLVGCVYEVDLRVGRRSRYRNPAPKPTPSLTHLLPLQIGCVNWERRSRGVIISARITRRMPAQGLPGRRHAQGSATDARRRKKALASMSRRQAVSTSAMV